MSYFVARDSIVRKIWGSGDTILLIFAGASAEFALNKAVDWLYFTGRLPADPLKRLFSTVEYARQIVFSEYQDALVAIDKITAIHQGVEAARGREIPEWAYRDVLYMLIDFSVRSYELLNRRLSASEKEEVYNVFYRMGMRMQVKDLPDTYELWLLHRTAGLQQNLQNGAFTKDLYKQYRKHLGWFRYRIIIQVQSLLVPKRVKELLRLGKKPLSLLIPLLYKISRFLRLKTILKLAILPAAYKDQVMALDA